MSSHRFERSIYVLDSFQGDGPKGNKACKNLIDEIIKLLLLSLEELQ